MKLTFLRGKNFLSFKDVNLNFKDQTIIVGPNNSGKSNLVRALKFARDICLNSFEEEVKLFLNKHANERKFELKIGFRLDEEEKKDLSSFTKIYANILSNNLRVLIDDLVNLSLEKLDQKAIEKLLKEMSQEVILYVFNLIHSGSIVIQYDGNFADYPSVFVEFKVDEERCRLDDTECIYKPNFLSSFTIYGLKRWFLEFLKSSLDIVEKNKKFRVDPKEWLKFILERGRLSFKSTFTITFDQVKREYKRELIELLSKYNYPVRSGIAIDLYSFIKHIFASRIVILDEIRTRPIKQFEDKQFKDKMAKYFSRIYYGTGEKLILFLWKLKNSKEKIDRDNYQKIKKLFKKFTDGLDFEVFGWPESQLDIGIINKDGDQIPIDYIGSGLLESLNIFTVLIGNEHCVITLDEPALHLHPVKQRELMEIIKKVVKKSNNQFIIITHSPYIIDRSLFKNVVRFCFTESETKIYPLKKMLWGLVSKEMRESIEKNFLKDPKWKDVLFAKGVIITEGESEEIGLLYLLQKAGFELDKYEIELLNAHGMKNFEPPVKFVEVLHIPYVIVCDSKSIVQKSNKTCSFSKVKEAIQHKIKKDKNKISNILRDCTQGKIGIQKARQDISHILRNYDVFAFEEEDFGDFLINKFQSTCQRLQQKGIKISSFFLRRRGKGKGKKLSLEGVKIIVQTATKKEVNQVKEIKDLINFLKKKFKISVQLR